MTSYNPPFSLFRGILLMTLPSLSLNASNTDSVEELLLTDFSTSSSDLGWFVVNDNVMGGRSVGEFEQNNGELVFTGSTNTNGGGFSSIRTARVQLNLARHEGIRLSLKGDGRRYTWRLATDASWNGRTVSYWADFETRNGTWSTVTIPFTSFIPRVRGRRLDGPKLDPGKITGMGLMIYDKQDGPFELRLANIQAYPTEELFSLGQYQWKSRVLIVSAPSDLDQQFIEQQNELALSPEEFEDRDMALIILLDNATSKAEDRNLTTEESAATRAELGIRPGSFAVKLIGKDGSVKLAAESATSMQEIYALIDTMPMRQREKQSH